MHPLSLVLRVMNYAGCFGIDWNTWIIDRVGLTLDHHEDATRPGSKRKGGKKKRNWVGRPTRLPAVTASHVVAAAEICGAFVTAKANLPPSRCGTSRRRGRSPRRSQTLTFPLSGSQGKAVWPLGKAEKEASGRVSATVFITTVLEKAAMSIEVNAMFQRDRWANAVCVDASLLLGHWGWYLNLCTMEQVVTVLPDHTCGSHAHRNLSDKFP